VWLLQQAKKMLGCNGSIVCSEQKKVKIFSPRIWLPPVENFWIRAWAYVNKRSQHELLELAQRIA
jgi:hypothetical protein